MRHLAHHFKPRSGFTTNWIRRSLVGIFSALFLPPLAHSVEPKIVLESTPAGALAFSPDGTWLAIGGEYKGPLKLWRVGGPDPPRVIEDVKAMYNSVAFSPNGKLLTASRISLDPAESVVSVWDSAGKKLLSEYRQGAFWSTFTPDSKGVAIGKYLNVEFLDPLTGRRLSGYPVQTDADVTAGDFAANGKLFATAGGVEKQLKLWDPKTGKMLRTIPIEGEARTLAVSPDAKQVAYAVGKKACMIDTSNGKQIWAAQIHTDVVTKVCYSPNGKEITTGSHDKTARRWNAADGALVSIYQPERGQIQAVAYSPDQKTLALGTSGVILLYDTKDVQTASTSPTATPHKSSRGTTAAAEPLQYKKQEFNWKTGENKKDIGQLKQGFAFITGVAGNFGGPKEGFELQATKSGAWTLTGQSSDFIAARSMAVTDLQPVKFQTQTTRYEWTAGKPTVKMLHQKDGICILTGFTGAMRGYGESVKVHLADDGYWYLEGSSAQGELKATAIGLKWTKPGAWTCHVSTHSWTTGQEPVNIAARSEAICVLSGVSGNLLGGGEGVEIVIEDEDKWVMKGSSQQQELRFDATCIQFLKAKK